MAISIQTLNEGDIFYECQYGINVEYVALCDAYRAEGDSGWAIDGKMLSSSSESDQDNIGEEQWFFSHDKYPAYGPKLYLYPEYG